MDADTFEYVVVGAGSAGCALAARLTEDRNVRVLLLEAGPRDQAREISVAAAWTKLFRSEVDWDLWSEPQPGLANRRIYLPRGRTLGGSSSTSGLVYLRGHRADYEAWAELGCRGWGWEDVRPYFARLEGYAGRLPSALGRRGPLAIAPVEPAHPLTRAFVEAALDVGVPRCPDMNAPAPEGVGIVPLTARAGRRCSAADAYLKQAGRRANLTIATGCRAQRIAFAGQRASALLYSQGNEPRAAQVTREIVLCAGAYGSPQLLMLSGVGDGAALQRLGVPLRHHLPEVGRNLQDHLFTPVFVGVDAPISLDQADTLPNRLRWRLRRASPLGSGGFEAAVFARSRPGLEHPDLEVLSANVLFVEQGLVPPPGHGLTLSPIVLQPRSRGRVMLREPSPETPPAIDPSFLSDPSGEDLRALLSGLRLARRIAQSKAFAPFGPRELAPSLQYRSDAELTHYVRQTAQATYDPAGTCRMGSDAESVVDPELRVRGVSGLRVADASIFPSPIRGHTNAPALMVGERAADLLRAGSA